MKDFNWGSKESEEERSNLIDFDHGDWDQLENN